MPRRANKNGYNVNRGAVSHTPSPTMARSAGQAKRPERSAFVGLGTPSITYRGAVPRRPPVDAR